MNAPTEEDECEATKSQTQLQTSTRRWLGSCRRRFISQSLGLIKINEAKKWPKWRIKINRDQMLRGLAMAQSSGSDCATAPSRHRAIAPRHGAMHASHELSHGVILYYLARYDSYS